MSRFIYATEAKCDWPECKSVGTMTKGHPPAGWVYLPDGINIDGLIRRDFCSLHAGLSLADLAAKIEQVVT